MQGGKLERAFGQFDGSQVAQVLLDYRPQIRCSRIDFVRQRNHFAAEAEEDGPIAGPRFDGRELSAKENLATRLPQPGGSAPGGVAAQLFRQPARVFRGEGFRLAAAAAAGNGDTRTAVTIDEEPVSASQRIATIEDFRCCAAGLRGITDIDPLRRRPEEFELEHLHAMPERKASFIWRNAPGLTGSSMPKPAKLKPAVTPPTNRLRVSMAGR